MTRRTAAPPEPRSHHVHGQRFDERKPVAAPGIERVPRVIGEPERAWRQARSGDSEATARRRRELAARLLAVPSPAAACSAYSRPRNAITATTTAAIVAST